ncbi:MAG TPA: SRPBCC domain-containing protein, partial [Rhodothermales bacterium]|nr:SRPBCC domain-containing protein [Rhodothermales bacterium]
MATRTLDGNNGAPAPAFDEATWPDFPALADANRTWPRLHIPGAQTMVRDRWERLVTGIVLPQPPEAVWQALTDPAALKLWLATCHGHLDEVDGECMLDFDDGEFFYCRPVAVEPPGRLHYLWRWLGIGQATSVTWSLEPTDEGTQVTVTEEALNPPWDWQTWNGGGWPGILDQLAAYLRTGTEWRWPWRRMGPYAQIEVPMPLFTAWDQLFSPSGARYWLQVRTGTPVPDEPMQVLMGDASGSVEMTFRKVVQPGESAPSFLPYVDFELHRPVWNTRIGGRLWMEPAGWGRSIFQVVHYNWENLPPGLQLSERKILTSF